MYAYVYIPLKKKKKFLNTKTFSVQSLSQMKTRLKCFFLKYFILAEQMKKKFQEKIFGHTFWAPLLLHA